MATTYFVPGNNLLEVFDKLLVNTTERLYVMMYHISVKGEARELVDLIVERVPKVKDVRFVLNYQGDEALRKGIVDFIKNFRGMGDKVKVWITDKTTAHAKLFILDNWLVLGSTNISPKALSSNFEANILTNDPKAVVAAVDWFEEVTKLCEPVNGEE
ncbi:MAG: phospholipase D-like domain-containing protein [Nitrososphaeria archaeon]